MLKELSLEYQDKGGYLDYKIGNLLLAKHLDTALTGALQFPDYAKQMVLKSPSEFPSGRVALYLCPCGDIGCGAITVEIEETPTHFIWRAFGFETTYEASFSQSEYMTRTGPFSFEKVQYLSILGGRI